MIKSVNSVTVKKGSALIPTFTCVKTKFWHYSNIALVFLLIFGVWCLATLPIIVYHLPKAEISSNTSSDINGSGSETVCLAPLRYTTNSHICLRELSNILRSSYCLSDPEGYILVIRNEENTAAQLINGLTSLGASDECLSNAVPFLCLHLFGLCDVSGVTIQPTSSQCEEIRDTTCHQEWMFIDKLDIGLPNCEIFPAESMSCPATNESLSTNGTTTTNMSDLVEKLSITTKLTHQECTGDYYQENGTSHCIQSCYSWVKLGNGIWIITDMLAIFLMGASFLASAALIVISCLARKRMLIFPAIFVVYMVIDFLILDVFILFGMMDRNKLFCPSRSLIKSLREVTTLCVIFGITETYIKSQMFLWWLFHTANLFWKVKFPFHARNFDDKNKYIHITCIIVGILLPLVPIIAIMADTAVNLQKQNENSTSQHRNDLFISDGLGFGYTKIPTLLCAPTNKNATFYSIIIMIGLILGCGCTMLIIIFWSVHNVYIKRKKVQKKGNLNINEKARPQITFGTAEKKLLFVLCYYMLVAAIILSAVTWEIRMSSDEINNLQKFLFCELGSHNSSDQCTYSELDTIDIIHAIHSVFSFLMFSLIPFVNLVYAVNIQELKKLWKKLTRSMVGKH